MAKAGAALSSVVISLLLSAQAQAVPLTGTIAKDYATGTVTFSLTMGSAAAHYTVVGATVVEPVSGCMTLCIENRIHMDSVAAAWMDTALLNEGTIGAFPRERRLDVRLMGFAVTGTLVQGMLNDQLIHARVLLDGHESGGALNYSSWTGAYTPEDGLRFGEYAIRGYLGDEHRALDLDSTPTGGTFAVNMGFGPLRVTGTIVFTDTVEEKERRICDDGDHSERSCRMESYRETVATSGAVDLDVSLPRRRAIRLHGPGHRAESENEIAARAFLAWLQMVSYDIVAR